MNPKLQLRPFTGPEAIARAAAVELHGLLKRRADLSKPFGIALSGGRIAKTFYEAIVSVAANSLGDFENVHYFWADERCVPPSDGENNFGIAQTVLFTPLQTPAENVHRIRAEVDPKYAVEEAEAEICRLLPLTPEGQPLLDLAILGMGEDGHVASLFPQEPIEMVTDTRVYRKVTATKPPPDRITLGYQPLILARELWVLVSGKGKAEALERVQIGDQKLPLTRVLAHRNQALIFCEASAG